MLPSRELSFLGRLRVIVRRPYWESKRTSLGSSVGSSLISIAEEEAYYGGWGSVSDLAVRAVVVDAHLSRGRASHRRVEDLCSQRHRAERA